jgi:hypothetical protein
MRVENMLVRLLDLLVAEWLTEQSPEEIAHDEAKVQLLSDVLDAFGAERPEAPERVRNLYNKVYLRDVWETGRTDWQLTTE